MDRTAKKMGLAPEDNTMITSTTTTNGPTRIELAKELGMKNWVAQREQQEVYENERKRVTSLGYKIVTVNELDKRLRSRYIAWDRVDASDWVISGFICTFFSVVGMACGATLRHPLIGGTVILTVCILLCAKVIDTNNAVWRTRFRNHMKLDEWTEDIPYEALLAVKKAKEDGFVHFHVHYLGDDPILTGQDDNDGPIVELAAW